MESQRELVAAAEALKQWVTSQRSARGLEPDGTGIPPSLLSADSAPAFDLPATTTPTVLTASSAPLVFPTAPPAIGADAFQPPVGDVMPPLPSRARAGVAKGMGGILPQLRPRFGDIGRMTLKGVAALLVLAAIGGAAMVAKLKWDDFKAARQIGTATFASIPSGSQVFVDGQPVGSTPVHVELPIGKHTVELRLKGAKRSQVIEVVHGVDVPLAIDWNAKPVGILQSITNPPGAKVIVDGKTRGVTPLTLRDLVVGTHTVVLEAAQGIVRRQVTISEGKTETLNEAIYPGWLHISAPIDVVVSEGARPLQLDTGNRVFLRPGVHEITLQNRELGFSLTQSVVIEPGGTAELALETPFSTLTLRGPDGSAVFVDGERVGELPMANHPVKIGSRDIRVVDRSGATYHMTVTVTKQPVQLNVDFAKP